MGRVLVFSFIKSNSCSRRLRPLATRNPQLLNICFALVLCIFLVSSIGYAFENNIEKDFQGSLEQSRVIAEKIQAKLAASSSVFEEIALLKRAADDMRITHLLLQERFALREEKARSLGSKAQERHRAMSEGYREAIEEYLAIINGLPADSQLAAGTLQPATRELVTRNTQLLLDLLNRLLPKKKRPIIGSLPYKHLNYPAVEPSTAPEITPAYRGGNKTVTPDDTKSTESAPISRTIAELAQSMNWQPVAIYEWVKNNVETEWYWGCMKGAEETLRQKSGNDCDQAVLLASLLRASGFPTRLVRANIEFFASDGKPIERVKNLTGIDDPWKIAEFFQKAGIPYKPIIAGGKIQNFEISHIYVESQIPYANYRGNVIDEHGKTWLGLDTTIKTEDYVYNNAKDIIQEPGVSSQLSAMRDEYLSALQTQTPLEYLQSRINSELTTQNSQMTYKDFLRSRTLPEEHMKILPDSMQFDEKNITGEYTEIPDELIHKVKFTATNPQLATGNDLFTITLPLYKLSNQQIAITYEPETVEDQEIINSYGGLDNTPAYLIRLRPVLTVNKERIIVAQEGLPMGADYNLAIELYSPSVNEGATPAERITNTLITGNLAVIGIAAQKAAATPSPLAGEGGGEGEKDAERLLYEAANHYIDRWNKAEDELASLLHLSITRPLPAVVTVGGVIDVTYLLDMPHGFTWKGVFIDADVRAVETVQSSELQSERQKLFMQLSSLQGSILENTIFEDDFQVASISTAKLFQLANSQLVTVDKTNIATVLPSLPFDQNIKDDIANSVNQNQTIRIPAQELTYENWGGIGYLKENIETGESGWMLSGMIAGGMTAWSLDKWPEAYLGILTNAYSEPPNYDPASARYIQKISATDLQKGTVGAKLPKELQVKVLDQNKKAVAKVEVTFTVRAGNGSLSGKDKDKKDVTGTTIKVPTNTLGIATAALTLGQKTSENPTFWWHEDQVTRPKPEQVGENLVDAALPTGASITMPFTAYGFPKAPHYITPTHGNNTWGMALGFAGFVSAVVEDEYNNPVSNVPVAFTAADPTQNPDTPHCPWTTQDTRKTYLLETSETCLNDSPTWGTCGDTQKQSLIVMTNHTGAVAQVILGGMEDAKYQINAAAPGFNTSFMLYTYDSYKLYNRPCDGTAPPLRQLFVTYTYPSDQYGNSINAGKVDTKITLQAKLYALLEDETEKDVTVPCGTGNFTCKKVVGTRQYATTTEITNPSVTFSGAAGTALGGGVFKADHTLKPGLNTIPINGTATVRGRVTDISCPGACSTTSQNIPLSADPITMQVYGVDIQVEPVPIIRVDTSGRTEHDYTVSYTITPQEYKAGTAYVMIYKNKDIIAAIATEKQGKGFATISRGFQFDVNSLYYAQVVLNYGTGVKIESDLVPLKIIMFKIVRPADAENILIKNDDKGDPKMPDLRTQVELKGSGIDTGLLNIADKKVCWQFKVEYKVNITKPGAGHRSRKGLNCNEQGVCDGKDGYFIPAPAEPDKGCRTGPTFVIDEAGSNGAKWDGNFGGGALTITAKTDIGGLSVSDEYAGAIQGQLFGTDASNELTDTNFRKNVIDYLMSPTGVTGWPGVLLEVNHPMFFRIIGYKESDPGPGRYSNFERLSSGKWKNLGPIAGYSSDYVYPVLNKGCNMASPCSDGGFGVMQMTIKAPKYKEIWNYKLNIDVAANLIKDDKLPTAKAYPGKVGTKGCSEQPYPDPKTGKLITPPSCRPMPETKKDIKTIDFDAYELRLDTYSLYNSNWHYWIWDRKKGWIPWESNIKAQKRGFNYVKEAEDIENKIENNNPPSDFN